MRPKTGEEGMSCTWHTLAFKAFILFFTSPQPSTHTVLCEQPAELLLSHCSFCFNFSKRGTCFYFLNTLITRSAVEKQMIYIYLVIWDTIQRHTSLPLYCTNYIYHMPDFLLSIKCKLHHPVERSLLGKEVIIQLCSD